MDTTFAPVRRRFTALARRRGDVPVATFGWQCARRVAVLLMLAFAIPAIAQSIGNGRLLYTTPLVAGQRSCSNGACHGLDPAANQNQIRNGGNASEIASAIQIVRLMAFLKDVPTAAQFADLAAYIRSPASAATTATLVEFYFAALDYYFITSRATEVALLDVTAGWSRTGSVISVSSSSGTSGTVALRRYYFDQVAVKKSRGSHFYTLVPSEQAALQALNPANSQLPGLPFDEGVDAYAFAPVSEGIGGACRSGETPVYRLFRGPSRFPDNPNHRFTTDVALYNSFVALGWDGEGVKFCVPAA